MQPYLFPYIGYFQLINAVDKFVFYDDVNFIKNGWINRNRILINNAAKYLTVQLKDASAFKLIKEIEFTDNREKLLRTIEMAYKKAPMFPDVLPVIEDCLKFKTTQISELAIYTVMKTCGYLGLSIGFETSSEKYAQNRGKERADRLKAICTLNNADTYINPEGGVELYSKEDFKSSGINLFFLKSEIQSYRQFNEQFVPGLSIIDVMMFNSVDDIQKMLNQYEIV